MNAELWMLTVLKAVFSIPGSILLLGLLALYGIGRGRTFGKWVLSFVLLMLYLFSTPLVSNTLIAIVSADYQPLSQALLAHYKDVQAIVILGGGRRRGALEYGAQDAVSAATLERIRYGAYLHRQTRLPILVSGGSHAKGQLSEALLMAESLQRDFAVKAKWQEGESKNTAQNASYSFQMLGPKKITKIFLVTDAWHLKRAVKAFRKAGFYVIPAPMGYGKLGGENTGISGFLPRTQSLFATSLAFHEILGSLWYAWRY